MQSRDNQADRIIFFDDVCVLCHWSVRFVFSRDRKGLFRFAALDSKTAQSTLPVELRQQGRETVLVYTGGQIFDRSDAVIVILKSVGGVWFYAALLFALVPKLLRDWMYHSIAKRRYLWFGKYEVCPIPPPELLARMLE